MDRARSGKRTVVAVAVLVIGLALLLWLRDKTPPPRADERIEDANHHVHAPAPIEPEVAAAQAKVDSLPPKRAPARADLVQTPALRAAFEREAPDATAHQAEARLRAIYNAEHDADVILRDVRCTRSVCKAELRWSPELNEPYNNALNNTLKEFSRDIDLFPDVALGGPEMPIPMTLYVARPGYSVASLVAEQEAEPEQQEGR